MRNLNSFDKVIVRVSYLQVYNECIYDLLRPERKNLNIREDKNKGTYVESLSQFIVTDPYDVLKLLKLGQRSRNTASTKVNDISSRSHAVFIVTVE